MTTDPTLPTGEFVLFCGAGISASAPSCAPLWNPMRDAIIRLSIDRVVSAGAHWNDPYPANMNAFAEHPVLLRIAPELLFQVVHASLGTDAFATLIAAVGLGRPNRNHRSIAELTKAGHICAIVTTNFDRHIEQSLAERGVPFVTIPDEESAKSWVKREDKRGTLPLLKVHGSLDQTASLVATVKAAGKSLSQNKTAALHQLLCGREVLIVGYSGRDYDVFPTLLDLAKSHVPAQTIVSTFGSVSWPLNELLASKPERATLVENISAESLFDQLCNDRVGRKAPCDVQVSGSKDWHEHIRKGLSRVPVPNLVMFLGRLAEFAGDHGTAISPFYVIAHDLSHDALSEARSLAHVRLAAEAHAALARCYIHLNRVDEAELEREQARQFYVELGEEYTINDELILWWCQTNGEGWLGIYAGDLRKAEKMFRNSVEQAETFRGQGSEFHTIGDETLVDAYIGLGDAMLLQQRSGEAEAAYKSALRVAEEFGSLWLAARADLALAQLADPTNGVESSERVLRAKRRLEFMGLAVEDIVMTPTKRKKGYDVALAATLQQMERARSTSVRL